MQLFSFYLVFITLHVSDAFLRPSSEVLQNVVAATGVSWVRERINPV